MAAATTRRRAAKPAPEPEVVETEADEFEEIEDETDADELEELTEEDEVEAKPEKAKRQPPKQPTIEFGSPWLAAYVTEKTGETYDARGIRMLLRKLAKDGALERTIGEDRGRYEFSGPTDPIVKAVLAMVRSGAAKELKQAGLQAVKDKAAATKAAKAKAAEAAAEDDDMDEVEVEEAPKPTRRRVAAKPAPAKATPAKATTRRAAAK